MGEQTRYNCLVEPCNRRKDYSLLTLYEHLSYHLKDRGYTEHFEYKCVPCKAYFTNKIFMVRHKMEPGNANHTIERLPEIDLICPQSNEKLKRAVLALSDDLLRYKFKLASVPDGIEKVNGIVGTPSTPKTPKFGTTSPYAPRTPRVMSQCTTPPRTPKYGEETSARDFSNCFANATPARSLHAGGFPFEPAYPVSFDAIAQKLPNLNPNMPHNWQVAAIREAFGIPLDLPSRPPMNSNHNDTESRFDELKSGNDRRNFRGRSNFDGGSPRGFRGGRNFNQRDDHLLIDSNRGGFRGGDGRGRGLGRGRGRGRGGFGGRNGDRENSRRSRSRSRSPLPRKSASPLGRRSYSRSCSNSPTGTSPTKNNLSKRNAGRESYSRSPQSSSS